MPATTLMTTEELLAMPDDGIERWLIDGELREASRPVPTRNRFHSRVMTCVATELELWTRQQPLPRGQVLTGDAGVRMTRDPDTTVGVDVVYVSAQVMSTQTARTTTIDGVPTLAVEILSPSDTVENIEEKVDKYLAAGVPLVWVIDAHRRTVTVHAAGAEPELFNVRHELVGDPHLPGLRIPVVRLFE